MSANGDFTAALGDSLRGTITDTRRAPSASLCSKLTARRAD
jgi:hypothetical protein